MTFDFGFLRLTFYLTGPSDPWYGPFVVAIPLGMVVVWIYYVFFDG
jgi:hypothetical protein